MESSVFLIEITLCGMWSTDDRESRTRTSGIQSKRTVGFDLDVGGMIEQRSILVAPIKGINSKLYSCRDPYEWDMEYAFWKRKDGKAFTV